MRRRAHALTWRIIAPSVQCAWRYGGGARRVISNSKKHSSGDGTLNPGLRMVAGAVAGIIAMSSTYHLDMVRGRLTVQEGRSEQYRGIAHAYQEIISKVLLFSRPISSYAP